jgi:murein DD-endopeptidase MepM/ murein hydrolase activator NlpD
MISPTGKSIRKTDSWGAGGFCAPRGHHLHAGVDFICEPGQEVVAPVRGRVERTAVAYPNEDYRGVVIQVEELLTVKLLYMEPSVQPGMMVEEGQVIGRAQDISKKYPGITPHIHMEVSGLDKELVYYDKDKWRWYVNPLAFLV